MDSNGRYGRTGRGGRAGTPILLVLMLLLMVGLGCLTCATAQTTEGVTDFNVWDPAVSSVWWPTMKAYVDDADSARDRASPIYLGQTPDEWPRILMPVWNKSGDTLKAGDVCVWDSTAIIVCDTLKNKKARILINLSAEKGWYWLSVVTAGTASNDTLCIYGLDQDGAAQSSILPITDGAASRTRSAYQWSKVDSIKDAQSSSGWNGYIVSGRPFMGVIKSAGANNAFAGIAEGSDTLGVWRAYILDNTAGFITWSGVTKATCDGGSTKIYEGDRLMTAANGDMAPLTAQTATVVNVLNLADVDKTFPIDSMTVTGTITMGTLYFPCAKALEPLFVNDTMIRVFVRP